MYKTVSGKLIDIDSSPMATGGEGEVFNVRTSKDKVTKIYFPKNRTNDRFKKLVYMVQNPPLKGADSRFQKSVIWPEDILLDGSGKFVGYIMPKVCSGLELGYFTVFMRHPKVKSASWNKLCFHTGPEFFIRRMVVCYNLCKAIALVHSKKEYQLCDLKPSNILIDPTGFVSVIDLDSIQIDSTKIRFLSTLYTPEYTSPEFIRNRNPDRSVHYDHFSLAVILYQLITGVHPFQGILKSNQDGTLTDNIKVGAFAKGQGKNRLLSIPQSHQVFDYLPGEVQASFRKTFDLGHTDPNERLSADEWAKVFKEVIVRNQGKIKAQNQQSYRSPDLSVVKKSPVMPKPSHKPNNNPIQPMNNGILHTGLVVNKPRVNPLLKPNEKCIKPTPLVSKVNGLII